MPHSTAVQATLFRLVPPALPVEEVRELVAIRLAAIEGEVLPMLARHRALLQRTWYHDGPDAALLHLTDWMAMPIRVEGIERLSAIAAEEHALTLEATALRDLHDALELYLRGGRATLAEIEGEPSDDERRPGLGATVLVPRSQSGAESSDADYGRWVLEYLLGVKRELRRARAVRGGATTIQTLQREHDALLECLEQRAAPDQSAPTRNDLGTLAEKAMEQQPALRRR
jgi:hypothetical protein